MDRSSLVATRLGPIVQWARGRFNILRASSGSMETLGDLANSLITRLFIERLCLSTKSFVDVGAHIGSVIDGVSRHSHPKTIYAFEAIPSKAAILKKRFPNANVFGCALGESPDFVPFYVNKRSSGYSSLFFDDNGTSACQVIEVEVCRLDDILMTSDIDLIKIDVEGAELGVLKGAKALIEENSPVVIFESGPQEVGGYTKKAIWQWLDQADYAILIPNRVAHLDDGLTEEGFLESHLYPRRTTDYVAVPRRRRSEIRSRARSILRVRDI